MKVRKQAPSLVRQTCRAWSKEPLASREPSGLKARLYTGCVCSRKQARHDPVSPSQSLHTAQAFISASDSAGLAWEPMQWGLTLCCHSQQPSHAVSAPGWTPVAFDDWRLQ